MIALTLAHIARVLGGTLLLRGTDRPETVVSGAVETDSREIVPGGVFVAKPGEETDGHLFVDAAVRAGAVLALVEREVDAAVSQIVVPDVVVALADLAREVRQGDHDVGNHDLRDRRVHLPLDQGQDRARADRRVHEQVTVGLLAGLRHEHAAGHDLSRVGLHGAGDDRLGPVRAAEQERAAEDAGDVGESECDHVRCGPRGLSRSSAAVPAASRSA